MQCSRGAQHCPDTHAFKLSIRRRWKHFSPPRYASPGQVIDWKGFFFSLSLSRLSDMPVKCVWGRKGEISHTKNSDEWVAKGEKRKGKKTSKGSETTQRIDRVLRNYIKICYAPFVTRLQLLSNSCSPWQFKSLFSYC